MSARVGNRRKRAVIVQPLDPEEFQIDLLAERVAQIVLRQLQILLGGGPLNLPAQVHARKPVLQNPETEVYTEPVTLGQVEMPNIRPKVTVSEFDVMAKVAEKLKIQLEEKK